jgi:hypothetical protein
MCQAATPSSQQNQQCTGLYLWTMPGVFLRTLKLQWTGVQVQEQLPTLQREGRAWLPGTTPFSATSGDGLVRRELRSMPGGLGFLGGVWCRLTHRRIMWPVRGHYVCSHCGRQFKVNWEAR